MYGLFGQTAHGMQWLLAEETAEAAWELRADFSPDVYDAFMVFKLEHFEATNQ